MVYYRYDASGSYLGLHEFNVIKTTNAGVWIQVFGQKKFILNGARKRYAYPTEPEALVSYYARKRKQVAILKANLERAEYQLKMKPGDNDLTLDLL